MDDERVFAVVRDAVIWAKAETVPLAPSQVAMASPLAEAPICLDSLETIAMITHLEDALGLVARDEHFFAGAVRTVGDVVAAVHKWIAEAEAARR
jgi:acyl carrier protein